MNDVPSYLEGLKHPRAVEGFNRDMGALQLSDACVMVMPCGPSASMEMGWSVGAKRPTYVYIPALREPDLMVKMARMITDEFQEILNDLRDIQQGMNAASVLRYLSERLI